MGFSLKLNHDHKQPIVLEPLKKRGGEGFWSRDMFKGYKFENW